jgi:hypothetical protein
MSQSFEIIGTVLAAFIFALALNSSKHISL